jgi:hypothetical protein
MLPLFESEVISGEAECDIMMIRGVIVRVRLVSNKNTLSKKRAIMEPIENIVILPGLRVTSLCVLIGTVLEMSGVGAIRH